MKVLFANNFCGYYGGAEQVVAHTARGIRSRGHTCYLAYGVQDRDSDAFGALFDQTFQCAEFCDPKDVATSETFAQILETTKPDIVFFHKVSALPPEAEKPNGPRTVRMVHDSDLFCPTGLGYYRHGRRVCTHAAGMACYFDLAFLARAPGARIPIKMASIPAKLSEMRRNHSIDLILANSNFVRERLILNGFPEERVHVCHPVLQSSDCVVTPVPEAPRILFVGALLRGKGVDLLLHALRKVSCSFSATIVGTGKSEAKLKSLSSSLGLDQDISFHGWASHETLQHYYDEAKVVAIPSRGPETFSLVGTEAMRHGRPVVAFDVGGISDWLDHERTGLLVPEQDVIAFAHSLERMLTDTSYASRLGEEAARRVRDRFSYDRYIDKIEAHLSGATT